MALVAENKATPYAYKLLAKLERRESGDERASTQWLNKSIDAPADPAWLCSVCGAAHPRWQAVCRSCASFDTLEWGSPGAGHTRGTPPLTLLANWSSKLTCPTPSTLAVFDFRPYAVRDDSFVVFLSLLAGWLPMAVAGTESLAQYVLQNFIHKDDRAPIDRGNFFKQHLLDRLIDGKNVESFKKPIRETQSRAALERKDAPYVARALRARPIASSSPQARSTSICRTSSKNCRIHALLCNQRDRQCRYRKRRMPEGNCVRQRKAERVANTSPTGPFREAGLRQFSRRHSDDEFIEA